MAGISSLLVPRADHTFPTTESPSTSSHVIPIQQVSAKVAEIHGLYSTEIAKHEEIWRDRYLFLLNRGLELRSRYRPGWIPSWIGTDRDPVGCEDSVRKSLHPVLDAKRLDDGAVVCIKRIVPKTIGQMKIPKTNEVKIGRYLSTDQMSRHPDNHCVPILDSFQDPILPEVQYIIMPLLRRYNDPEFCFVGEVVDFVTQLLEGMNFMHSHLVAHEDLTSQNIMMDARPILPQGWHLALRDFAPNGVDPILPLARIDHPVRYFIVDYDCSIRFGPGQSHILESFDGREGDPPELKKHLQYDAFKLDVFTLGHVFDKDLYQVYEGLEFLKRQIEYMKTPDFRRRPTAQIALQGWLEAKAKLDISMARWRLRRRDEFLGLRVMRDAVSVVQQSFDNVTRMLNPQQQARVRTWSNP